VPECWACRSKGVWRGRTTILNFILLCEELGRTGSTCFMPMMMNNSVAETINFFGSEEVKKKFIPPLCDGTAWATTAFTEPGTGSDPRAITSTAEPDGDGFVLNGTKRFISMANKPGWGVYYCRDATLQGEKKDVTAFLVDKKSEGYSCSKHYKMMGLEGSDTCDVFLKNVRVPRRIFWVKRETGSGYCFGGSRGKEFSRPPPWSAQANRLWTSPSSTARKESLEGRL